MTKSIQELSRQQKWRKRNPKQYLAHLATQAALRHGVIERAPCSVCGAAKAEAHHPDYERPYDVIWLCRTHHKALHASEVAA
jgi:pterin-4a-carbinolamine dehydratase